MTTLNLTDKEIKLLRNLVATQRGRYGLLKSQFSIDIKTHVRELNSVTKKLKAAKVD